MYNTLFLVINVHVILTSDGTFWCAPVTCCGLWQCWLTLRLLDLIIPLSFLVCNCLQGDKVLLIDFCKRRFHIFVSDEKQMKLRDTHTKLALCSSLFVMYFVTSHLQISNDNEVYSKHDVIFEELWVAKPFFGHKWITGTLIRWSP